MEKLKEIILNGYNTFDEAVKDSQYTSKTEAILHILNKEKLFLYRVLQVQVKHI